MSKSTSHLTLWIIAGSILLNSPTARAECTASAIGRMVERGKTVASIARVCEMAAQDVRDIIDTDEDSADDPDSGSVLETRKRDGLLPRGAPVGQCGCWGPADPSARVPQAQCKSGSAEPRSCGMPCSAGGVAWQGVCS